MLFIDVAIGIAALGMIMHCSQASLNDTSGRHDSLLRFWQSRFLLALGTFSYSLYLFHQPLIDYSIQVVRHFHLPFLATWFVVASLVPVVIGACYVLYLLFEKPFLNPPPPKSA